MKLYIRHTDKSQTIYNCNAIEDVGRDLKIITDLGIRYIEKFAAFYGDGCYHPGIESYQLDGYPVVWVKQYDNKEDN